MSIEFYRMLHFGSLLALFFALGGMLQAYKPGAKLPKGPMMLHGIALLAAIVAGVGLLHKRGLPWDLWVYGKIGVWVLLGVTPLLLKRGILAPALGWVVVLALGVGAVWLGIAKPVI